MELEHSEQVVQIPLTFAEKDPSGSVLATCGSGIAFLLKVRKEVVDKEE